MRIIAGLAKGRRLLPPEGMGTRPTLDRVKESIFDILGYKTENAIVLDAFAGTGSLGLEACSRGAKFCYLVDKGKETFKILEKNIENLRFNDKCKCFNMDSYEALNYFSNHNIKFNLIFIDPPYSKEMIPPAVDIISEKNLLEENGLIATKIDTKEELYYGNDKIILFDHRKYGNTTICFYKQKEA